MKTIQQKIQAVVRERSQVLHHATSDVTYKKELRERINVLDDLLIDLMALLPDNRPEFPRVLWAQTVVGNINGVDIVASTLRWTLQSVIKGVAKYVTPEKFDPDAFSIEPYDRVAELQNRRTLSREVIQTIKALEALDVNAVEADEDDEAEAQVAVVIRQIVRGA